MSGDANSGRAPRIADIEAAAKSLRLKRNGATASEFAKRAIEMAIIKTRIDPGWSVWHKKVAQWATKYSGFNPVEHRSAVTFAEPWDALQENPSYLLSQAISLLREMGEF